jgi:hypothetical protein
MIAHRWRRDLKDVGDQALIRGLVSKRDLRPRVAMRRRLAALQADISTEVGHRFG